MLQNLLLKKPSIKSTEATGKFEDDAKELYNVMPMYNLLKYNNNFFLTSRSLWKSYAYEICDVHENDDLEVQLFKYKTKTAKKTEVKPPLKVSPPPYPDGSSSSQPPIPPVPPKHLTT